MPYVTQVDMERRFGAELIQILFDDGSGGVDTTSLGDVRQGASDWTDSVIALEYTGPFPLTQDPLPAMVREATLLFAIAFSYDRKPSYARVLGDGGRPDYRKLAEKVCNDIKVNLKRIVGYTAEPNPANVGGGVYIGTSDETPDGVGMGIWSGGFGDYLCSPPTSTQATSKRGCPRSSRTCSGATMSPRVALRTTRSVDSRAGCTG